MYYHISTYGRVKSLATNEIFTWACGRKYKSKRQEKILAQKKHNSGYKMVSLRRNKNKKYFTVHRLVAIHFIPNPLNKRTVNHKNGIKWDNRIKNLEWNTDSENGLHSFEKLGRKGSKTYLGKFGKHHNRSKPVFQFDLNGKFIREWENAQEIRRKNGWQSSNIQAICLGHGRAKTAHGYKWQYK